VDDLKSYDILPASEKDMFMGAPSFSLRNRLQRAAFGVVWVLLARWTPPQMSRWRNLVLRMCGAKLHPSAKIYASVRIWHPRNLTVGAQSIIGPRAIVYDMAPIIIGSRVVVSQGAHLCAGTHSFRDPSFQLQALPITLEDGVWIAAEAFVGPGVTVGRDAVLGARAVTTRDLVPNSVNAGNPARVVGSRYAR
jgi:putative colanic acid biosynthesis acetyltransferase WcaF